MTNEQLMELAKESAKLAYAPYSDFHVGAALLTKDGTVYTGCNIENASYGATICAERTAIFKAVSEGKREFEKIAVTAYPCGMCLQVMQEFMPEGEVIVEQDGVLHCHVLKDLLPAGFTLSPK